jgi:hypothetical protein
MLHTGASLLIQQSVIHPCTLTYLFASRLDLITLDGDTLVRATVIKEEVVITKSEFNIRLFDVQVPSNTAL